MSEALDRQPRVAVRQCGITAARDGVARHHRHLPRCIGGLVAFEATVARWPIGWGIVGRPTSRVLQERGWIEVTRCATDGTPNACSALYGAASRHARKAGSPILTYTLESEPGTSLRAAGWVDVGTTGGGDFDTPSRARVRRSAIVAGPKRRWWPGWLADAVLTAVLCAVVGGLRA